MGPDLAKAAVFVRDRRLLLRGRLPLMTLLLWYKIAMIIGSYSSWWSNRSG